MSYITDLVTNNINTKYLSSDIDFCEKNNDALIVETFNTISSLAISLYGLYGLFKSQNDNLKSSLKNKMYLMYCNLIFIGLCSAYFHATISSLGHLFDVYSISCVLSIAIYAINENVLNINHLLIFLVANSIIGLLCPFLEIFILFLQGIYVSIKSQQIVNLNHNNIINYYVLNHDIKKRFFKTKILFVTALLLWLTDFFFCEQLNGIHLHFIFHILIGKVGYEAIDIIAPLIIK